MKQFKVLVSFLLMSNTLSAFDIGEKIYIDSKEMDISNDRFRIHVGHNKWIETSSLTRDERGLFTLESNVVRSMKDSTQYAEEWRCPYCYNWWPMKKKCRNEKCPSKFTEDTMRVRA